MSRNNHRKVRYSFGIRVRVRIERLERRRRCHLRVQFKSLRPWRRCDGHTPLIWSPEAQVRSLSLSLFAISSFLSPIIIRRTPWKNKLIVLVLYLMKSFSTSFHSCR
ncbi:hypothetical protein CsSME_00017215 [Camellia sinensis var. sinensis]